MSFNFKYQLWFFSIIAITFFSCGKDSACFKGTGKIVEEQRVISSDVTMIRTQNNIDIVITQSNEASLTIEGGENLLPYINTDVSGTEITISSDNKCSMLRDFSIPITAYLSLPNITKINYTGQGDITSTNTLNLTSLDIESRGGTGSINLNVNVEDFFLRQHSGPADFTFTGSVNNSYVYTLGSGWFYLNNFLTNNLHVSHNGTGDVVVNANKELIIELRYIGNVEYYGNPNLNVTEHTGTGEIIKK